MSKLTVEKFEKITQDQLLIRGVIFHIGTDRRPILLLKVYVRLDDAWVYWARYQSHDEYRDFRDGPSFVFRSSNRSYIPTILDEMPAGCRSWSNTTKPVAIFNYVPNIIPEYQPMPLHAFRLMIHYERFQAMLASHIAHVVTEPRAETEAPKLLFKRFAAFVRDQRKVYHQIAA